MDTHWLGTTLSLDTAVNTSDADVTAAATHEHSLAPHQVEFGHSLALHQVEFGHRRQHYLHMLPRRCDCRRNIATVEPSSTSGHEQTQSSHLIEVQMKTRWPCNQCQLSSTTMRLSRRITHTIACSNHEWIEANSGKRAAIDNAGQGPSSSSTKEGATACRIWADEGVLCNQNDETGADGDTGCSRASPALRCSLKP